MSHNFNEIYSQQLVLSLPAGTAERCTEHLGKEMRLV